MRQCTGNQVIYRRGGIRRTLRTLEAGQGVAMLIDQHMHGPDAVAVDFFNRPGGHHDGAGGAGAARPARR